MQNITYERTVGGYLVRFSAGDPPGLRLVGTATIFEPDGRVARSFATVLEAHVPEPHDELAAKALAEEAFTIAAKILSSREPPAFRYVFDLTTDGKLALNHIIRGASA